MKSDVIKAIFGNDGGEKLLDFIRGCIIPHEQSYCFYLRKDVRHFETTTNSGHEGTNHAIKSGPSRVLPQHAIDKSAKIQLDMDCNKFDLYRRHLATALLGRATWSTSLTVNDITLPAEFMLKFAIHECENYASWRTRKDRWLVVRSVEREVHSLVPHFHRVVYTVTLHSFEDRRCLLCDCKYFECNGMVCQHLVHVKMYYAAKSVITHHDISVRWWKAYLYFAMKNVHDCSSTEADIKRELDSLRGNECQGPTFSEKIYDHTVSSFRRVYQFGQNSNDTFWNATERCLALLFKKDSVINRVINYSRDEVMVALKHSSTNVPISMSQEVHLQHELCDDCHDGGSGDNYHDDDDDDAWLIESKVDSDCIDFGSRVHHQDEFPDLLFYNPYDMFMPRVKELVSIVAASKNCRERGLAVEEALDNIISVEKANLASEKPPPIGGVVSSCPVGKVKKSKVSAWCG